MFSYVLGVKIDHSTLTEALQKASGFLSTAGSHTIFTPNPEMLVKSRTDSYFKDVLNSSDLNICDGFGINLASGFSLKRITGVDFMLDLCAMAEREGKSVYLLGSGSNDVVRKAAENLQKKFPNLNIVGYSAGPKILEIHCHSERSEESLSRLPIGQRSFAPLKMTNDSGDSLRDIRNKQPDLIFVAFGMGKQEKWIYENLAQLPSIKIAMGVGGAFDYLAGVVPRAPRLMRILGLEWLYRLIRQPRRLGRIWNATVKFCYLVLKEKIYGGK